MKIQERWKKWNENTALTQNTVQKQLTLSEITEKLQAMQTSDKTIDSLLKIYTELGMDAFTLALNNKNTPLLKHPSGAVCPSITDNKPEEPTEDTFLNPHITK